MLARIKNIIDETAEVKSFRFDKIFNYTPGQWAYFKLNDTLKHHFTLSSSSTEDFLQFTTKFRKESDYKKALWQMKTGDNVEINGPFGSFVLDEKDTTPRIFVAGGIGITPFRSMLKYTYDKKLNLPMILLYSVKTSDEAIFLDELRTTNQELRIVETTKEGRLSEEKIKKYCPNWKDSGLWLCGPPAMVEAFAELGQKLGLPPEKIRSEEFTGY